MTPRPGKAVGGDNFARQVREQHASFRPTKKFKSVAPKGSKFAAGYTDRAKARQEAEDAEDDKAKRIKALEEQVKLGQLEQATFEALRDEITGGDVGSTHLVKGLDKKLLERVRRGEDVLGLGGAKKDEHGDGLPTPDVDDELDQLVEKEVEAVHKEQSEKKGVKASQVAGKKRTRDEIMAELKAQRKAAAEAKASSVPVLDSRWRRVGDQAKPKVEIDHKGREVITITNEDGTVKKMIRKVPKKEDPRAAMPDVSKPVLGADVAVPEQKKMQQDEESDEDIFGGVGTEYDPLGGADDYDDSSSDSASDDEVKPTKTDIASGKKSPEPTKATNDDVPRPADSETPKVQRNYFGERKSVAEEQEPDRFKGIENVLKKASQLGTERSGAGNHEGGDDDESESTEDRQARLAKRAKMLAQQDRDMDDIDMGFGESRFEDEADFEDAKIKLSQWKGKLPLPPMSTAAAVTMRRTAALMTSLLGSACNSRHLLIILIF